MTANTMLLAAVLMLDAIVLHAADMPPVVLRCDGALGNSGEQGATLVRFGPNAYARQCGGVGVAVDRFGTLWSRGGDGVLNRYAIDGRQLAQFDIPRNGRQSGFADHLALVGDLLVLQINRALWTLPVTASPGSVPTPLKLGATHISFNSLDNSILAADENKVLWIDVRSGAKRPLTTMDSQVQFVEVGPGGTAWVVENGRVHQFVEGRELISSGWPRPSQGDRPQFLGGFWFTTAYHGTLRRFNAAMEADPGVVLGGGSGSFIGHLDENPDVEQPRGVAQVREGLYAVCGAHGIVHLLVWQPQRQQFDIVRRIGCLPICRGLGLDRLGNIWCNSGVWHWDDRPDTPLEHGIPPLEGLGAGQVAMLDADTMIASYRTQTKLAFVHGSLDKEAVRELIDKAPPLRNDPCGAAVYRTARRLVFLVVDAAGQARAFYVGSDGKYATAAPAVALRTAQPLRRWTTLGMEDDQTLVAAADGQVIRFSRVGNDWMETGRWNSWGSHAAERFGDEIHLAADADRLWVSDTLRHRVLVFALKAELRKPIAVFGAADRAGDDLLSLSRPTTIAASGRRAVVYDSENQRLLKMDLP